MKKFRRKQIMHTPWTDDYVQRKAKEKDISLSAMYRILTYKGMLSDISEDEEYLEFESRKFIDSKINKGELCEG